MSYQDRLLNIELVPESSWCNNVRSHVKKSSWDRIRKQVYKDYQHKCGICNSKGALAAHEIWNYDDSSSKQTLIGMIALCGLCHHVKHIGFAEILANQGKLNFQRVVNHYCKINKCTNDEFWADREEAFYEWSKRSRNTWSVDISYIERY